jgi:hypothetical protein
MACKHETKTGVEINGVTTATCLGCRLTGDDRLWNLLREAEEKAALAETPVQAWFTEMRTLMTQLYPNSHVERFPITLVALSNCYGARCSSFAATGDDTVTAMARLRDKIREAVAKHRAGPPDTLRTG